MRTERRDFIRGCGAAAVAAQPADRLGRIEAFAFDAYGTLFDVFSVTTLCEELFPGDGRALAQVWRVKQLQYSLLRSLMGRHKNFWQVTEDALSYAAKSLDLDLTAARRDRLMEAYLTLAAFPDVRPGLESLKSQGVKLAILSNGCKRRPPARGSTPCSMRSSASRTSRFSKSARGCISWGWRG